VSHGAPEHQRAGEQQRDDLVEADRESADVDGDAVQRDEERERRE
jgi:hypothetical protein